jgi:ankyrin repeat protein
LYCIRNYGNLLNTAAANNQFEAARKIIEMVPRGEKLKIFVNHRSELTFTPLYAAAYQGKLEMMQLLLNAGAEIDDKGG